MMNRLSPTIAAVVAQSLLAGCAAPDSRFHGEGEVAAGPTAWKTGEERIGYSAFELNVSVVKPLDNEKDKEHSAAVGVSVGAWEQTADLSPVKKPHDNVFERREATVEAIVEARKEITGILNTLGSFGMGLRVQHWGNKDQAMPAGTVSMIIEGVTQPIKPFGETTVWLAGREGVLQAEARGRLGAEAELPNKVVPRIGVYGVGELKTENNGEGIQEKNIMAAGIGVRVDLAHALSIFAEAVKTFNGTSDGKNVNGYGGWFGVIREF